MSVAAVASAPVVHTRETELVTPSEMLDLVADWTGDCPNAPGNADVLEVLLSIGVEKEKLVQLAYAIARGAWTRRAAAALVIELLGHSRVRAAVARHGRLHHGISMCEARRDLRTLRSEARELVQREILLTVDRRAGVRGQQVPA